MKSEDTMSFHAPDPEDDDNISLCSCLLRLPQMAEIIKAFSDDETLKSLACRYVWWLMRQKPPAAMSNLWVAELAKKRWNKKLVPEKVKLIQDKYRRPASCPTVCSLTVNDPEIWAQLQHYQRRVDLTVANIQQTVRKAALLSLKTASALVNTKELDVKQLLTKSADSIALLGHVSYELSGLRREKIKASLKPDWKH